jgi:hypothetical protein
MWYDVRVVHSLISEQILIWCSQRPRILPSITAKSEN